MVDIEPISRDSDENTTESLDEVYKKLYDSLGVEPGLLSRTSIGSKLRQSYNSNRTTVNAKSVKSDGIDLKDSDIDDISQRTNIHIINTISEPPYDDRIVCVSHPYYKSTQQSLCELIREYQLRNGLSYLEVVNELNRYIKTYHMEDQCTVKI